MSRVIIEATERDNDYVKDSSPYSLSQSYFTNNIPAISFQSVRTSYLNLVDLAGSERQKLANTTGKTLKEGNRINDVLLSMFYDYMIA